MKKVLIVFLCLIVFIVAAAVIIPIVFKDDIKAAIDEQIEASVNADVIFDVDNFSLSLFSNFPNITVKMADFGVINRAPFEGEILFAAQNLEVEVNLKSVLFDDQMRLSGIYLNGPEINIKVMEDGTANYDIAIPSDEVVEVDTVTEATEFSFGIDHWAITNANILYDDKSIPITLVLKNMNHEGSGDFSQDLFDLSTNTSVDTMNVIFDGTEYISNKRVGIDMVIAISEEYSRYEFKENKVSLNEFALGFDGYFKMNEDGYDMDITYQSKDNSFKSLLSLVPGVFTEGFEDIKTAGNLSFGGAVNGSYSETQMPAFNLNLEVGDAMFQYPDLPAPVNNIAVKMLIDNKDGIIDNTSIDISKMHLDFGKNPFDARLKIENLKNYKMDANLKASLDLGELVTMFPVEGLDMKGKFTADVSASGVYDSINNTIPKIKASMAMANGYVKSSEFPVPLEDITLSSSIDNTTGKMADTKVVVEDFHMLMDGEEFNAQLVFENLDNYTWDLTAKGGVDLEKITKLFPLEGMTLAGHITADMHTKGNMADLDAERYDKLPTSGSMSIDNFSYKDAELPYDVTISKAVASFNPEKISLTQYQGTVGKSDMKLRGEVSNYIGYIFGEGQVLKGRLNYNANLLDLNEFMEEEEEGAATAEEDTTSLSVIPIPKDIHFVMNAKVKSVKVMDMELKNADGKVVIKNGVANLTHVKFGTLGGQFDVSGSYDTRNVDKPKYDLKMDIKDLSIAESFNTFSIVKKYVPLAKGVVGNVSTNLKVDGLLKQDMMPDLNSVKADGIFEIAKAALTGANFTSQLATVTKLNNTEDVTIKDVVMSAKIQNGQLSVKPFDISIGNYKTTVSGASSLDGNLDYTLNMEVPTGALGNQVNNFLSQYGAGSSSSTIKLPIGVGGTLTDPKYKLKAGSGGGTKPKEVVKDAVKEKTKEELDKQKDEQRKKIIAEAENQAKKIRANGKKAADKARAEGYAQADKLVKEAGSNFLKKRIAEEAAKKLRAETDKKANNIQQEANKKANALVNKAKQKAAAL